jgi:hypothetical protein
LLGPRCRAMEKAVGVPVRRRQGRPNAVWCQSNSIRCGVCTTDKNDLIIIRADYPAAMVATTRGDDLMVANALRGYEAYCKNTNGARRHVFRALHLPTAACTPRAPRAPPCAIHEDQQIMRGTTALQTG